MVARMTADIRGRRVVESMGSIIALPGWKVWQYHLPGNHGKLQNFLCLCVLIYKMKGVVRNGTMPGTR